LNWICNDIFTELKSGTVEEAGNEEIDPKTAGLVAKLWHIVLWIGKSSQRLEYWTQMTPKLVHYDVDTWWNLTYDMISDAIWCKIALIQLLRSHQHDLRAWSLSQSD